MAVVVDGSCGRAVIVVTDLGKQEYLVYLGLGRWDNTYNHIFGVQKSFQSIQTSEC